MKEAIDNFIELLVKGDFFLVFLIVMILVVVLVTIYLIKVEINERKYFEDMDEDLEMFNDEFNLEKQEDEIKSQLNPFEKSKKEEQVKFEEDVNKEESSVKTEVNNIIDNYEDEMEKSSIISAEELDQRLKTMKDNGQFDLHEKEIERYENEQEEKAIISYDELLKRAGTGMINYEESEDLGGVRVSKVDFSNAQVVQYDANPYMKEELFLEGLKEFRRSL